MFTKALAIAVLSVLFAVAPALAGDDHKKGRRCKYRCGGGGGAVTASEPLALALTGAGLLSAAVLRRRSQPEK